MDQQDRYSGRPLLRLLEAYVLAVIGALPSEREEQVSRIVRRLFDGDGDWKTTLKRVAGLPDDLDERILSLWRMQPGGVDAISFMTAVSDENFVPMIDPL